MKLQIKESPYVVGCKVSKDIYLNPGLKKKEYTGLRKAIIQHELKHSHGLDKHDIFMDLVNEDLKGHKLKYWKFMLTHPRSLVGLLPLMRIGGVWAFDLALFILWVLTIVLGVVLFT